MTMYWATASEKDLVRFIGAGLAQSAEIALIAIWLLRLAVVIKNLAYLSKAKSKAISVAFFMRHVSVEKPNKREQNERSSDKTEIKSYKEKIWFNHTWL